MIKKQGFQPVFVGSGNDKAGVNQKGSSTESAKATNKPAAVKNGDVATPAKKVESSDDSSSEESYSEEEKVDSSDENSEEDEEPQKKKVKPSESKPKAKVEESSSDDDDDESSDEEPAKTHAVKKDGDVEMVDAPSAKKASAGEVVEVRFAMRDDRFAGYGHVEFATRDAAQEALKLHEELLLDRPVKLDLAKERGAFTPASGGNERSFQKSGGQAQIVEFFLSQIVQFQSSEYYIHSNPSTGK
ncbi:hypothetical protein L2E82_11518 [Cichorium intybus]|uniref:Uncharacterized protein n=1 Tax=Cichorium intybus TaxID=13427 RepID=A0ACB9GDQ0_CICIN|nr:hypothetical protein L2E82_11518 [Cichorium intybus]